MTAEVVVPDGDFLAHYGKKGMKWGEHRAKAKANHNNIMQARANQAYRGSEINKLTAKRLGETSAKGKQHLDSVIADKKFALQNHPDAATAARLTTGEKWLKGAKVAAVVGMSLAGFGTVASVGLTVYDQKVNGPARNDDLRRQFINEASKNGWGTYGGN